MVRIEMDQSGLQYKSTNRQTAVAQPVPKKWEEGGHEINIILLNLTSPCS